MDEMRFWRRAPLPGISVILRFKALAFLLDRSRIEKKNVSWFELVMAGEHSDNRSKYLQQAAGGGETGGLGAAG